MGTFVLENKLNQINTVMEIFNLCSPRSNRPIANQFVVRRNDYDSRTMHYYFQSYSTMICDLVFDLDNGSLIMVYVNRHFVDGDEKVRTNTTTRWFNQFLLSYCLDYPQVRLLLDALNDEDAPVVALYNID